MRWWHCISSSASAHLHLRFLHELHPQHHIALCSKIARPRHHHDDKICFLYEPRFLDDCLTDRRKVARRHGDSWRGRMPTENVRLCRGGHWHSAGAPCDQGRVPGL